MFGRFSVGEVAQLLDVAGLSLDEVVIQMEDKSSQLTIDAESNEQAANELEMEAQERRSEARALRSRIVKLSGLINKAKV